MDEVIDVVEAKVLHDTRVWFRFSDGAEKVVDLRPIMRGPVYDQIFESGQFDNFVVSHDSGTIVWPNGADIAPETLRYTPVHVSADSPLSGSRATPPTITPNVYFGSTNSADLWPDEAHTPFFDLGLPLLAESPWTTVFPTSDRAIILFVGSTVPFSSNIVVRNGERSGFPRHTSFRR